MGFTPWVLLIAALVPYDFPVDVAHLPHFSVIDYVCAAALIHVLCKVGPRRVQQSLPRLMGRQTLICWLAFAIWVLVLASWMGASIRGVLRWGEFLFCYCLARMAITENPRLKDRFVGILSWGGSLISAVALGQCAIHHGDHTRVVATFGQQNVLAAFLTPCLFAAFALSVQLENKSLWIYKLPFLLTLGALVASGSRGGWFGLTAAVICASMHPSSTVVWRRRLLIGMAIAVLVPLACISLYPGLSHAQGWAATTVWPELALKADPHPESLKNREFSLSGRPDYWYVARRIILSHPWTGVGPGGYALHVHDYLEGGAVLLYNYELSAKKRVDFWQHLHSIYLQILVEYGFPGLLLWGLALSALAAPALGRMLPSSPTLDRIIPLALIAFLIHNTVDILFVNSIDLLMAFIMAIWA